MKLVCKILRSKSIKLESTLFRIMIKAKNSNKDNWLYKLFGKKQFQTQYKCLPENLT